MIRYPLVELLVSVPEMCNACASCGLFENSKEGEQRFKRCARCKLVYYVRLPCSFDLSVTDVVWMMIQCSAFVCSSILNVIWMRLTESSADSVKPRTGKRLIDLNVSTYHTMIMDQSRRRGGRDSCGCLGEPVSSRVGVRGVRWIEGRDVVPIDGGSIQRAYKTSSGEAAVSHRRQDESEVIEGWYYGSTHSNAPLYPVFDRT